VDLRFTVGSAKRYPIDWVFCSMRCQACFHRLYVSGLKAPKPDGHGSVVMAQGADMIDPNEAEIIAMRRCLKPLGDAASAIGINRPRASYEPGRGLAAHQRRGHHPRRDHGAGARAQQVPTGAHATESARRPQLVAQITYRLTSLPPFF